MISPDPHLRHLDLAWSSHALTELFDDRVLPKLIPGSETAGLTINDITYSPGRRNVTLCTLEVVKSDGSYRASVPALVTFAKDDRLHAVHQQTYGSELNAGSAVFIEEYQCLIELFPADWQLPTLAAVLSSGCEVIHYSPHRRCVLRFPGEEGSLGMVGKLFPDHREAGLAWNNLSSVHSLQTGFSIPEPLQFVSDMNLMLMAEVSGCSLQSLLEDERAEAVACETVMFAARALASFHAQRLPDLAGDVRTVIGDIGALRTRVGRVHLVASDFARKVDALLLMLESKVDSRAVPVSLIHGDFKPSQLLVSHKAPDLVDFDRTAPGDPALDVGNFMAELRKVALSNGRQAPRWLATEFLACYRANAGEIDDVADRVLVAEALALARLAVRDFRHAPHQFGGSDSLAELLLEEALQCAKQL